MFLLKPIIFKLYGYAEKVYDSYKNPSFDNKGIFERYNESVAEDFDENIAPLINQFVDNTMQPSTAFFKFIPYLENMLGMNLVIYSEENRRRKYLSIINKLYDIKGTIPAYVIMLKWQGFSNVYIVEHEKASGFDSPVTFDDSRRRFDSGNCQGCNEYSIQLEGNVVADSEILDRIYKIIEFNEPINAKLRSLTLNGDFIVQQVITVYISDGTDGNQAGDLIYNNDQDPTLTLRIADASDAPIYQEGDLIIGGPNKDRYAINAAGDLIYTTGQYFFNNALRLNGGTQYVEYPLSANYQFSSIEFEIIYWLKPLSDIGLQPVYGRGGSVSAVVASYSVGKIRLYVGDSAGAIIIETVDTFPVGEWIWVTYSVIGSDVNDWKIYVNNIEQNFDIVQNDIGDISNINEATVTRLGEAVGIHGNFEIDELILKGGIMSSVERSNLYAFGDGADPFVVGIQDIRLRSNFDEILGTSIFDQSTYNNTGALNGPGDTTNRVIH